MFVAELDTRPYDGSSKPFTHNLVTDDAITNHSLPI